MHGALKDKGANVWQRGIGAQNEANQNNAIIYLSLIKCVESVFYNYFLLED